MATHKFGKLKINRSEDGFAFRFGDGKIHRLGFGKKRGAGEVDDRELYEEDYQGAEEGYDQGDYSQDEYSGRFAQPSGGRVVYEDDYDGGYEDGYDDGYGDYDDGYQDSYDDRDYDDGDYVLGSFLHQPHYGIVAVDSFLRNGRRLLDVVRLYRSIRLEDV